MEKEKRRRILIIAGNVIASVVLLTLGMWLGTRSAKQSTPKPEPTQKVAKVVKPAPVVTTAPALAPAANNTNIYPPLVSTPTSVLTPKPAPALAPVIPQAPALTAPAPPPQATSWLIITGQPQTFINGWGYQWLIDPNGNFQCPRVDYPTSWTGGQEIWVYHIAHPERGWYTTWAPACYR